MNVKMKINPAAGKDQRLLLLLNKIAAPPGAASNLSIAAPPQEGKIIRIPITGVPEGDYLVRISINGIESPLQQEPATGKFIGPQIKIGPAPPAVKRLRSTNIEFTFSEAGNSVTLTGTVTVKDENGVAIKDASVSVTWTLPDGTIMTQSATTAANGIASFVIQNGRGNYRLKVKSLAKTGYAFEPNSSGQILEKGISIFASNKLIAKTLELSGIEKENVPLLFARARVFVRDENNIPILEATVRLRWTFRNQAPQSGVTEEQTAFSKTDGIAWFTLQKGEGTYRAEVLNLEKGGFTFLPDQGTTQNEHDLPNIRLSSGSIFSTAKQETDGTFTVKSGTKITAEAVPAEVPAAIVIARWVLPGPPGSPIEKWQERLTDAQGNISFEINNGRGLYQFFISDIFKDGYTFKVEGSGLHDEITVP